MKDLKTEFPPRGTAKLKHTNEITLEEASLERERSLGAWPSGTSRWSGKGVEGWRGRLTLTMQPAAAHSVGGTEGRCVQRMEQFMRARPRHGEPKGNRGDCNGLGLLHSNMTSMLLFERHF